jgi:hypothetical protein
MNEVKSKKRCFQRRIEKHLRAQKTFPFYFLGIGNNDLDSTIRKARLRLGSPNELDTAVKALLKKESNFAKDLIGLDGEVGIGQIMYDTAMGYFKGEVDPKFDLFSDGFKFKTPIIRAPNGESLLDIRPYVKDASICRFLRKRLNEVDRTGLKDQDALTEIEKGLDNIVRSTNRRNPLVWNLTEWNCTDI